MVTCSHCHKTTEARTYKCRKCQAIFCRFCALHEVSGKIVCPECHGNDCFKVNEKNLIREREEAKRRAEEEAERRAEEEAKRRAEMLRELENRQYGLGMRIGNRYYSDYDD